MLKYLVPSFRKSISPIVSNYMSATFCDIVAEKQKNSRRVDFHVTDLIEALKSENGEDIVVIKVPPSYTYVDHLCIVTGKSYRHMFALSQTARKSYKMKLHTVNSTLAPRLEGRSSKDWMAIDFGSVALHIFSNEARLKYDLETLWAVGKQYDQESLKRDEIADMLESHSVYATQR